MSSRDAPAGEMGGWGSLGAREPQERIVARRGLWFRDHIHPRAPGLFFRNPAGLARGRSLPTGPGAVGDPGGGWEKEEEEK